MTPNLTINITVSTPEAAAALLHGLGIQQDMPPAAVNPMIISPPASATPYAPPEYTTAAMPSAPANTAVPTQSSPPVSIAPAVVQTPAVPTSIPSYTYEDLARAAAPLTDAGKIADLQALLRSFGVQAITQLPKEQYGAFAIALRSMGARI